MAYIGKIPGVTILSVNDLTDVNTDSPQAGEFLIYDSATSAYLSQAVTTDTITEGNNLYYTTVRFDSDLASATSIAAIRGYVSASGDLSYDSGTGVFSIDVETIYTTANFDSDFNIALDGAALGGTGLTYNSSTNTLSITNTGVVAGTYGSTSEIPVFSVNAQGQIDSAGVVSVAGVTGVDFDSATGFTSTSFVAPSTTGFGATSRVGFSASVTSV